MKGANVARGDLFFLWQPGDEYTVSGFGLAMDDSCKDHLVGLLLVDPAWPVSALWLADVEMTFGDVELYTLTEVHEQGLACQMRIVADSLPYVRQFDLPITERLRQELLPLLSAPPKPRLLLAWIPEAESWRSEFDEDRSECQGELSRPPLFALGRIVATPGALTALGESSQTPSEFLEKHVTGDWGDLDPEDQQSNEDALKTQARIFSAYETDKGERLWVITEWDRSATTLLLPSEY